MNLLINLLTISRIFLAIIIFLLLMSNDGHIAALVLFIFAGVTDYLDGYLARKYNLVSEIGEILDPIADKILIIFLFIAISLSLSSYLVGFLSALIISREVFVAALRDYNARNNNNAATKVTFLAKIKTTIQLNTIFVYLLGFSLSFNLLFIIGDILLFIATIIIIYTGISYTMATLKK